MALSEDRKLAWIGAALVGAFAIYALATRRDASPPSPEAAAQPTAAASAPATREASAPSSPEAPANADPRLDFPPKFQAAMAGAIPAVQACYERQLRENASSPGQFSVSLGLEDQGGQTVIRDASITNAGAFAPFFEPCVLDAVKGLKMPPLATKRARVAYPFVLRPGAPRATAPPSTPEDTP